MTHGALPPPTVMLALRKESENESRSVVSTLCDPIDYTVHGSLQARILDWVAVPFSRGSSQPGGRTRVSRIAGRFFTSGATREEKNLEGKCPVHWGSRSYLSSCLFALHLCTPLNASNTTSLAFSALLSSPASSSLL